MSLISTPHIVCEKNMIAKTVIMPGDPKRSKYIAKKFLKHRKLVNDIRGVQGYTGEYNGKLVTVMASGMGNASMGIYSKELFVDFGVENIIRVGTCGAMKYDINLGDVIVARNIYTKTNFASMFENNINIVFASKKLVDNVVETAKRNNINCFVGTIFNTDTFYEKKDESDDNLKKCLAVEMESASSFNAVSSKTFLGLFGFAKIEVISISLTLFPLSVAGSSKSILLP